MVTNNNHPEKRPKRIKSDMTLGLNLAIGVGIFTFIGYKIDEKSGGQVGAIIGMFFGLFYCAYVIWKTLRQMNN